MNITSICMINSFICIKKEYNTTLELNISLNEILAGN